MIILQIVFKREAFPPGNLTALLHHTFGSLYVPPRSLSSRHLQIRTLLTEIAVAARRRGCDWASVSELKHIRWHGSMVPAWLVCAQLIAPGMIHLELQKYPQDFEVSNWRGDLHWRLRPSGPEATPKPKAQPKRLPPPLDPWDATSSSSSTLAPASSTNANSNEPEPELFPEQVRRCECPSQ